MIIKYMYILHSSHSTHSVLKWGKIALKNKNNSFTKKGGGDQHFLKCICYILRAQTLIKLHFF